MSETNQEALKKFMDNAPPDIRNKIVAMMLSYDKARQKLYDDSEENRRKLGKILFETEEQRLQKELYPSPVIHTWHTFEYYIVDTTDKEDREFYEQYSLYGYHGVMGIVPQFHMRFNRGTIKDIMNFIKDLFNTRVNTVNIGGHGQWKTSRGTDADAQVELRKLDRKLQEDFDKTYYTLNFEGYRVIKHGVIAVDCLICEKNYVDYIKQLLEPESIVPGSDF